MRAQQETAEYQQLRAAHDRLTREHTATKIEVRLCSVSVGIFLICSSCILVVLITNSFAFVAHFLVFTA